MSGISSTFLAVSDLPIGASVEKVGPRTVNLPSPGSTWRLFSFPASNPLHHSTSQFGEHEGYSKKRPCREHGFAIFYDPVFTMDTILNYPNNVNNN